MLDKDADFNEKWCQIFASGCLFLFLLVFAIIFSPFLICCGIYFLGYYFVRGVKNRWNLFECGEIYCDSYFIDGFLVFIACTLVGGLIGRMDCPETAGGAAFLSACASGLLEIIYYAALHMKMPNDPGKGWDVNSAVVHEYGLGSFRNYKIRSKTNWSWIGYEYENGPKEDLIFPTKSE